MNITIAKLKFGINGREGVKTYTADILLDGKKVGDCREDGNGGSLNMYPTDGASWNSPTFKKMDEWCKTTLPKWKSGVHEGQMNDTDLELHISNLVSEIEMKKALARDTKKGICYTDDECKEKNIDYKLLSWRGTNIEKLIGTVSGRIAIKSAVEEVLRKKGGKILNTNLGDIVIA